MDRLSPFQAPQKNCSYWIVSQDPFVEAVQVEEEDIGPLVEDPGGGERKGVEKIKCERVSNRIIEFIGCL